MLLLLRRGIRLFSKFPLDIVSKTREGFTSLSSRHERQKRCIVIQKQSGTHGDSAEGEDEGDYRRPQPKDHKSIYKPIGWHGDSYEAEEISPELQKLRKRFDRLRLKKINRNSEPRKTGTV